MNEYLQRNKRPITLVLIVFILLACTLYMLLLRPLQSDLSRQVNTSAAKQEELLLLKKKLSQLEESWQDQEIEVLLSEKRIPLKRDLDQFILTLQAVEQRTNSFIEHLSFSYDSQLNVEAEKIGTELEISQDGENIEEVEQEEQPSIITELPSALEMLTIRMTVRLQTLDDVLGLTEAIETEDRLMLVNNLDFTIGDSEEEERISLHIDVSTFYYPE